MTQEKSRGGRLALLQPSEFNSDQKKLHATLVEKILPWAKAAGFQAETKDGQVVGPFNPMLRSPVISQASLDLVAAEQEHTALSKKVREVVILSVGAVWKSEYELYAHTAVARKVGLDEQTIAALVAGQTPDTLSTEERVAHRFTRGLVAEHRIDRELYQSAVDTFGEKGVVDLIFLVGNYLTTCALLNAFAVPAPAAGQS